MLKGEKFIPSAKALRGDLGKPGHPLRFKNSSAAVGSGSNNCRMHAAAVYLIRGKLQIGFLRPD